ncbi:hypothetical protein ES703_93420 [subsurface metagenome]
MNILVVAEGAGQALVLGKMGQGAQVNLRIVGGKQLRPLRGDKGPPHLFAQLPPDGDILQIRLAGREPPRGRPRLVKAGVQPPRFFVD